MKAHSKAFIAILLGLVGASITFALMRTGVKVTPEEAGLHPISVTPVEEVALVLDRLPMGIQRQHQEMVIDCFAPELGKGIGLESRRHLRGLDKTSSKILLDNYAPTHYT